MSIDNLLSQGFAQLGAGDFDAALATADRLIAKKAPEGHGLRANALAGLERIDEAVAAITNGLERFPEDYGLHVEKGVILTSAGRFDEAERALHDASQFDDADAAEIGLAMATCFAAQERWDDMLECLSGNEDWGELEIGRLAMQLSALAAAERWEDALAFTQGILDESGADLIDEFGDQIAAAVHAVRAMALLEAKNQPKRALSGAWEALQINPFDDMALLVIRKAAGKTSPEARTFAIECEVAVEGEDPFDGGYVVIADTQEEAMAYVSEYESQVSGGVATLVDVGELTPIPDEYCGLVEVAELGEEEEDDEDFSQN